MSGGLFRYRLVFALSWLTLFIERFWASYWPAVSVVIAFLGLACLKFFTLFGNTAHIALLFIATGFFYYALVRVGPKFKMPEAREVRRAVEQESELTHRPLEAMQDRPVVGSPKEAVQLWARYQERLKKFWTRTKIYQPKPGVSRRDPYSTRFAALLLLLVGLGVAQQEAPFRIKAALSPGFKQYISNKQAALDAWIVPPDYTKLNPVFLATTQLGATPVTGPVSVPENSVLKIRLAGYDDPPVFTYDEAEIPLVKASAKNFTLEMPLNQSGVIKLVRWYIDNLGQWDVTVVPDKPPGIVMLRTEKTKREQLKLTYTAKDDYRVKEVSGIITPTPELAKQLGIQPIYFDIPTPETGDKEQVHTTDLTSHPLAGSEVILTLTAKDDIDQTGTSEPYKMTLPERTFTNPVAQAIIFQRKQLIWYNNMLTRPVVAQKLFELSARPENYKFDDWTFLGLTMAYKRLMYDGSEPASVASLIPFLWDIAIRVEDGGLALAQRELSEALQKLAEKLRDKTATKEEIQQLMDKVQEKSREYARNLANEMQQRMQDGKEDPKVSKELMDKIMKQIDIDKVMKEMEELTKGSEREQMEKMAERMKNNIDRMDSKNLDKMQKGQKNALEGLDELQKLIERQQQLMDKTNKMLPEKDRLKPEEQKSHEQQEKEKKEEEAKQQQQQNQQQQGQEQGQQQQQKSGEQGQQQGQQNQQQPQQQGQQGQKEQQGQQQGQQQSQQQQAGKQGESGQPSGSQGKPGEGQQGQAQGGPPQPQPGQQGEQPGQQGQGQRGQSGQGTQGQQQMGQGQNGQQMPVPQPGKDGQQQPVPQPGKDGQQQQMGQGGQQSGQPPMPQPSQGFKSAEEKAREMMGQGKDGEQQQQMPGGKDDPKQQQMTGGEGKDGLPQSGKDGQPLPTEGKDGEPKEAAGEPGEQGAPLKSAKEGATEQGSIRDKLGDIMRKIGEGVPKLPDNFGSADQEMKQAGKSLRQDNAKDSLPHQKEALDQLQDGMDKAIQQMADQMTDTMVNFGIPRQPGPGGYGDQYDPLGRPGGGQQEGTSGNPEGFVNIPDEKERRRVQEIIDELRARSNDYTRPKSEREYIDRLLNQFE